MVKLSEIMQMIESFAPPALAEDYDNVGLLVQGKTDAITRILLCLDADEHVVSEAEALGAELILSHHPLMFKGISQLTERTGEERTLRRLIQKGIGLYAAHTNLDSVAGGMCDALLDELRLKEDARYSFDGNQEGVGRFVVLKKPIAMVALAACIREAWGVCDLSFVGDSGREIQKIGFCNGGGSDLTYDAYDRGAEAYISGDFKYHHARFALENGLELIDISHYDVEKRIFCKLIKDKLTKAFGDRIEIFISETNLNPWKTI